MMQKSKKKITNLGGMRWKIRIGKTLRDVKFMKKTIGQILMRANRLNL